MKRYMMLFILTLVTALNFTVSTADTMSDETSREGVLQGTVVDNDTGKPLHGVNVMIVHTTVGTATDKNGRFRLTNVPNGDIELVVSMIGYRAAHRTVTVARKATVIADFQLTPTILELGAIVVTGTATPHVVEDQPVRTEVIPRRLIRRKQASNLAEALSFHTGVQVENNCSNCNFSQVRILGMDGKYSQILIDGDPVVSSLAGVYGLEHFPEEMVDQIEIVKGGGSALYGGGAVAGVVNMITRRPAVNQVRIKYRNHSIGGNRDQHVGAVAERIFESGRSGAYVFGSFRNRDPYDHNGDGFSNLGLIKNESMGFKWYYNPIENGELLASFHRIHEERRGGNKFDLPVHEADIAEWLEHWRSGGTLRWSHRPGPLFDYRVFYSFSHTDRRSYFGGLNGDSDEEKLEALSFYGRTENPLQIVGFQSNYRLAGHLLTAGIQHSSDKLMDETAAETAYHVDAHYTNTGIFVQDNMHIGAGQRVELVAGIRIDRHSELADWIFSPRISGKLKAADNLSLRAAYTTGFKPPQTYDEDLHLGGLEGDQRIIRNAPGLDEERSYSLSSGIEFLGFLNEIAAMASVTAFVTRINNSFTEEFVSKQGATELWHRVNSDGARIRGVEADLGIRPAGGIEIRGGVTYKKSRYDSEHEDFPTRNFFRTPDLSGNLRLFWSLSSVFDLSLHGNYMGRADVPHEIAADGGDPVLVLERSDDYVVIDLGASYRLPLNHGLDAKLNFGVKNILDSYQKDLDAGVNRDPAYVYGPARPRTLYVSIETAF